MTSVWTKVILSVTISLPFAFTAACGGDANGRTSSPDEAAAQMQSTSAAPTSVSAELVNVVTTSNIVADWVSNVGGDRVRVTPLLPQNADPHTFQPGARDIAQVADADLMLAVGLSLEASWLTELVSNSARDPALIVELGDLVEPIEFGDLRVPDERDECRDGTDENADGNQDEEGDRFEHEEDDAEAHGSLDPHFWFDPNRVKRVVDDIAARLSTLDPNSADLYRTNARAYSQELSDLHSWIEVQVSTVPPDRRMLVTSHDSFQYFACAYGLEIVGAVFSGGSTEREPSPQEIAELIDGIRSAGAPAVFTESSVSDALTQRIAVEAGARVVTELYTGSLGEPGGRAGTYLDFMRYNVATIVGSLK